MWKSQGRACSRNLGRSLILRTRKGTFFQKRAPKIFVPPTPIQSYSALYWNKSLYIFCKWGQRSIVKCNIRSRPWGLEYALQGVLSWNFQEVSYIQVCRISRVGSLFSLEFPVPGVFSKKSENLRN